MRASIVSKPQSAEVASYDPPYFDDSLFPDKAIGVRAVLQHEYAIGLHAHSFTELIVISSGSGQHFVGGHWRQVSVGDAFVIPPGTPHAFANDGQLGVYHLIIKTRLLATRAIELLTVQGYPTFFAIEPYFRLRNEFSPSLRLTATQLGETIQVLDLIDRETSRRPANGIGAESLTFYLITLLCGYYSAQHAGGGLVQPDAMRAVKAVIGHIDAHYAEKTTLDDLAAIAHMSRDTLGRLFRKVIGLTPMEHLNQVRIGRAREMLLTTDRSVTAIALETGFYDGAHFTKCFSKLTGVTPTRFRQQR